jgi:uncharacterized protein YlbG (UPF0298 family)
VFFTYQGKKKKKKKKITNAFFFSKRKKYLISYVFTSDMKIIPCIIEMQTLSPPLFQEELQPP